MGDTKLYSAQDVEKLKEKVATYKDTLTTLKLGNSTENQLLMKNEINSFKTKITDLEKLIELMDAEKSMQIEGYKQEIKSFSVQIDFLNQTVKELNEKISLVMKDVKIESSDNSTEKIKPPIDLKIPLNLRTYDLGKEGTLTNDQSSIPSTQKSNLPPSYKQFQEIINQSKSIEEVPIDLTPMESFSFQKNVQVEDQYSSEQNSYLNNLNPSQLFNELNKSHYLKPVGNINNQMPTKRISIKCTETTTLPQPPSTFVNDDKSEESVNETPIVEVPTEEIEETLVQEEETVEISTDSKEEVEKNKDPLSFLSFLWKKV